MDTKEKERLRWHKRQDKLRGVGRNRVSGKPRSLTEEQVQELLAAYDLGWTIRALAIFFQRAPSTILRYTNQHRIPRHQKSYHPPHRYRPKLNANWWEVGIGDAGADTELFDNELS